MMVFELPIKIETKKLTLSRAFPASTIAAIDTVVSISEAREEAVQKVIMETEQ
jgi:hypothetical protein